MIGIYKITNKINNKAYRSNSCYQVKNILVTKNYLGGYKNEYR